MTLFSRLWLKLLVIALPTYPGYRNPQEIK
jgi:hypothetical protein